MINLLPILKKFLNRGLYMVKSNKRIKYALAACIDLILIILIIVFGRSPAQSMLISPITSSLNSVYSVVAHKTTEQSFAFVPGLARNKFDDTDLKGLYSLSFFDVPLTEEGGINYNSRGYSSFMSDEALMLFERAREKQVKIFLTLSAVDGDTIRHLLTDPNAQENLADQIIEEIKYTGIDGITIDFEYPGGYGEEYQTNFTNFISNITERIHASLPDAKVAVAIPNHFANKQSIYDSGALSKVSDKIFLIASDFIVPEVKDNRPVNPIFGFNEKEYFNYISNLLTNLFKNVPSSKVVMERAWYGNGDNYPLYRPNMESSLEEEKSPLNVIIGKQTLEKLIAGVPAKGREAARRNIPLIAQALDKEGILDSNVLAYALATVEHETDETFEPLEEIQGRFSARRRGYEGGMNYFGRGFIQLTHLRNYRSIGERIGMGEELVKHPELATVPEVAAKILAAFFKDNNVANLASRGHFVAARNPINPDINGWSVAMLAMKYDIYE